MAIERKEEYALVNMPMLPVTHGESSPLTYFVVHDFVTGVLAASFLIGMSGPLYLLGALLLGLVFLYWAVVLVQSKPPMRQWRPLSMDLVLRLIVYISTGRPTSTSVALPSPQAAPVQMQRIGYKPQQHSLNGAVVRRIYNHCGDVCHQRDTYAAIVEQELRAAGVFSRLKPVRWPSSTYKTRPVLPIGQNR